MSGVPFQPLGRDVAGLYEGQRNLWRKLQGFEQIRDLPANATLPDVVAKINEVLHELRGITRR